MVQQMLPEADSLPQHMTKTSVLPFIYLFTAYLLKPA